MSKKLFFILNVCILFFTGCTTEESVKPTEAEAQEWFNTNVTSEKFQVLKYTQKIDWNNAIVTTGEHGEIIEVPFTVQSGLKIKVGEQPYLSHHRLLMKKSADGFTYNHVQILTKNKFFDNTDKSFNFYQITDDFDGIVLVVNQNNETVQFSSFKNSLLVKPSITGKMVAPTCVYLGWLYDDGDFEPLMLIGCFGGGGDPSDNGGYPPHVGGGGSGGAISAPTPVQIIDALTGKAKCIFEKLKNSSSGFESAIKKFDGEFTVSHLKLTINDNLEPNVYGITLLPVNYITEVQISNAALQSLSDLGKATVFAHEIIHAEIFRKMLSAAQLGSLDPNNMNAQQQTNYVNSLKDNFPGLYDYFLVRYKPTWNHEMMANHYRTTIADIIQKFDNNRLPRSTYEAVSWVGLGVLDKDKGLTTIAWDNLTSEERTAINKLISENIYNGPSNCN
jgi:hypothetical protein